jgi:NAD(P)-dependent dehydrogenase (short-subunit alcohol dehydrogenase family)
LLVLEKIPESTSQQGHRVLAVKLDMDDSKDHKEVAELIEKDFGVLDILINNAAIQAGFFGRPNATSTIPITDLRKTLYTIFCRRRAVGLSD